jgi:hypothetical protein
MRPEQESSALHATCAAHGHPLGHGPSPCPHCHAASTRTPSKGALALRDLFYRLLSNTTRSPHHLQSVRVRQACRLVLRTHSDLLFNPLTALHPWGCSWWTVDASCTLLGGTYYPTAPAYMANRFTWICAPSPARSHALLLDARMAVEASTGPARVAMLTYDTPDMRSLVGNIEFPTRASILATAEPHALTLHHSQHLLSDPPAEPVTVPVPLALILIENESAPGFTFAHMSKALTAAGMTPSSPPPLDLP